MGYKAVARLKMDEDEYIERGESVSAGDVGGKEELKRLAASGSVLEDRAFAAQFPEVELGENQPTGTPSNLEQVEGTDLEAKPPAEKSSDKEAKK